MKTNDPEQGAGRVSGMGKKRKIMGEKSATTGSFAKKGTGSSPVRSVAEQRGGKKSRKTTREDNEKARGICYDLRMWEFFVERDQNSFLLASLEKRGP